MKRRLETKEILIPIIIALIPLAIFIAVVEKNKKEILQFIIIAFSIAISIAIIYLTIRFIIFIKKRKAGKDIIKKEIEEKEKIIIKEEFEKKTKIKR